MKRAITLLASSVCFAVAAQAAAPVDFDTYLLKMQDKALEAGISPGTVEAAFKDVKLRQKVIKSDKSQPEFKMTLDRYLERAVPQWKIDTGRELLAEHEESLARVAERYGVQPRFIVALWGIESNFGRYQGNHRLVDALTSLAYEGRRESFFTRELIASLEIVDEGHIPLDRLKGSWAGAMGQIQFMPTSFQAYAQDGDGDGRKDIWGNTDDVFASAANYLKKARWSDAITWGREVYVPADIDPQLIGRKVIRSLHEWQDMGITQLDGRDIPVIDMGASLIQPDGPNGRSFLIYDNYRALMRWNRSDYFGTAVGLLSDAISR